MPPPKQPTPDQKEQQQGLPYGLGEWLRVRREKILEMWEEAAARRPKARPLDRQRLRDHLPYLLDRIAHALEEMVAGRPADIGGDAPDIHALQRLDEGFDLDEVTDEYALLRRCILELIEREMLHRPSRELVLLNEAIDRSVGQSVARYFGARARTLRALDRITNLALGAGDLDAFLPQLLTMLMETTESIDAAALLLQDGDALRVRAAVGAAHEGLHDARLALSSAGPLARVFTTKQPLYLHDASTDDRMPDALRTERVHALYAAPLVAGEEVIGVAVVGSQSSYDFSDEDLLLIRSMAGRATTLITQARLLADLKLNEQRFREFLLSTSPIVWSAAPDGRIESDSPTWRAFTGQSFEQFRGTGWLDAVHPGDRDKGRRAWSDAVARGTVGVVELRVRRHDGAWRDMLVRATPLRTGDGTVREWIGANEDITARRTAERALEEREEQFRTLADNMAQLAWMADGKGDVYWFNERWHEFTGTTLEEMKGLGWRKVHHPEHVERVVEKFARHMATGELWEDTFPLRGVDGQYRWFLSRAVPLRDAEGRIVRWFGTNTDVTRERETSQALAEGEERLQLALDVARLGTWEKDLRTGHLRWDARSKALYGLGPDAEFTEADFLECVHPDDRAALKEALRRALLPDGGGRFVLEHRVALPGGDVRWARAHGQTWFDENGAPTRVMGVTKDITVQRTAEDRLREQRLLFESLRHAQSDLGEGVTIVRGGRVQFANEALCRMLGLSAEELERVSLPLDVVAPEQRAAVEARIAAREVEGHASERYETTFLRRGGGRVQVELAVKEMGGGQVISIVRDITERKRTEAGLQSELLFREKLMGVLGHDLRNPLAAIRTSTALLLRRGTLGAAEQRTVLGVDRAAARMHEMIDAMVDFTWSRFKGLLPLKPEPCNLCEVARHVVDETEMAHGVKLRTVCEGDLEGLWDASRLSQVLSNLIGNAVRHGDAGEEIQVRMRGAGPEVLLEVHNGGTPIPPEALPHLFEPFSQVETGTRRRRTGLGLGLYIVQQVVASHGGTVSVRSEAGEGTTFTVRLPREAHAQG